MLQGCLDLLFPRRSLTGGEGDLVTAAELAELRSTPVIIGERELRMRGVMHLDRIVAAADYDALPLLHRAIHTFKYRRVRGVGEALGVLLVHACWKLQEDVAENHEFRMTKNEPVLCPVPLHWIRKFSRGFNQAELLARVVGEARRWEVCSLLRRTRWTGSQVGRRREERLRGVQDAFAVRSGITLPPHVILVDDLSTTGATLNECAKALKTASVRKVEGLVLALG